MSDEHAPSGTDRRQFLGRAVVGAGALAGITGMQALIPSFAAAKAGGPTCGDIAILGAAQIAEALAVTTYSHIIDKAPFFRHLESDDQGYLKAARQEEMSHYLLQKSVTGRPSPLTTFYYPSTMFSDAQTTLNVWSHSRTRSSPRTWSGCGTSAPPTFGSPRHGSWDRERPSHARARSRAWRRQARRRPDRERDRDPG